MPSVCKTPSTNFDRAFVFLIDRSSIGLRRGRVTIAAIVQVANRIGRRSHERDFQSMRENQGPKHIRRRRRPQDEDKKAGTNKNCFLVRERRGEQFGCTGDAQNSTNFHHARYRFHVWLAVLRLGILPRSRHRKFPRLITSNESVECHERYRRSWLVDYQVHLNLQIFELNNMIIYIHDIKRYYSITKPISWKAVLVLVFCVIDGTGMFIR